MRRAAPAAIVVAALILLPGCAPRRLATGGGAEGRPTVGLYAARIAADDGRSERFRLLLFAELPDRVHAEVILPLGGTALIVDGTERRMSVAIPRDRLVYVGTPAPEILRRLTGVEISTSQFVSGLLRGPTEEGGYRVERDGADAPALPSRFRLTGNGRVLDLRLKRRSPLRGDDTELGEGQAPPGFEILPLAELDWEWLADG